MPVRIIFEHLEAGDSLEVFLEDFPCVNRELAIQVLEDAKMTLVLDAEEERILALQERKAELADSMYSGAVGSKQPLFSESDLSELLKPLSV